MKRKIFAMLAVLVVGFVMSFLVYKGVEKNYFMQKISDEVKSDSQLHPIEKKIKKCMENAYRTVDMNECMFIAQDEWNKEIDKYYNSLNKVLDKDSKKLLETSQKEWEEYEKAQSKLYVTALDKQGTMYQNFVVGFQTELYKQRAMELERLYEVVILK